MENDIVGLLSGNDPRKAQEFILAFGEQRAASWADSQRQAVMKSASTRHVPHFRGQLRHQLGEAVLARAAETARTGCIPIRTVKPGGVFMVARVGRFGLVSLSVSEKRAIPRKSATRRLLSEPNDDLDPQQKLLFADRASARGATELAYFGCMITCPSYRDPSTPSDIVFAVPNARLTDWIEWLPITKLFALLQSRMDSSSKPAMPVEARPIPDLRIPRFRLPRQDRDETSDT